MSLHSGVTSAVKMNYLSPAGCKYSVSFGSHLKLYFILIFN